MRKFWSKRIGMIEKTAHSLYGEEYFKQWLKENPLDPTQDLWALQDTVPIEFRMFYIFHILDQLKKARRSLS